MQIIHAEKLSKSYLHPGETVHAIKNVDLEIDFGEFVVIYGPSGSGKSTLLHLIGAIDKPSSGIIEVNGKDLSQANDAELTLFRRDNIGFVFQFFNLISSLNALDNIILPLLARGTSWSKAREIGMESIKRVGLGDRYRHKPGELSGGEQQRVAIARAMIVKPCVILADEPTGDLDINSARSIMELMAELNHEYNTTIIVATHNLKFLEISTKAYDLISGEISPHSNEKQ